jgi:hypothetical protein
MQKINNKIQFEQNDIVIYNAKGLRADNEYLDLKGKKAKIIFVDRDNNIRLQFLEPAMIGGKYKNNITLYTTSNRITLLDVGIKCRLHSK